VAGRNYCQGNSEGWFFQKQIHCGYRPEKKEVPYEVNPMVNCDEPEVVFGTSLAYIV
jgi:hypothetical protein